MPTETKLASASAAERALVGALLYDTDRAWPEAQPFGLVAADFADAEARVVWEWVAARVAAGQPVDLPLAADGLRERVEAVAVERLVDAGGPVAHVASYANEIVAARKRRLLSDLVGQITATAARTDGDAAFLFGEMQAAMADAKGAISACRATADILAPVTADAWLAEEPTAPDYAVEGVFEIGDRVLLVAPSKCRKSFFALQLAACLAAGRPFLGLRVPAPRRVLLMNLENRASWQARRLRGMCAALRITANDFGAPCRLATVNARHRPVAFVDIGRMAEDCTAEVVLVDPLYAVTDAGNEMNDEERRAMLDAAGRISSAGRAVVLVQHDPKGQAGDRNTRDRGSGLNTVNRAVDATLALTPYGDARDPDADSLAVLSILARNTPPRPDETIRFCDGAFTVDPTRVPVKATSRNRWTPDHTQRNLAGRVKEATLLVSAPMAPGVLKETMRDKMRLGKADAETLLAMLTAAGGPLERWASGTWPQRWLVGTREHRMEWRQMHLPSLQSQSSQQDDTTGKADAPVVPAPLLGAGQQDSRQVG
jgi:hypothetical protein